MPLSPIGNSTAYRAASASASGSPCLVAQNAQYLLLDEPIAALDLAHQIEVLALVRQLSHEAGLGLVVVLHDVNMAARFCDEIMHSIPAS